MSRYSSRSDFWTDAFQGMNQGILGALGMEKRKRDLAGERMSGQQDDLYKMLLSARLKDAEPISGADLSTMDLSGGYGGVLGQVDNYFRPRHRMNISDLGGLLGGGMGEQMPTDGLNKARVVGKNVLGQMRPKGFSVDEYGNIGNLSMEVVPTEEELQARSRATPSYISAKNKRAENLINQLTKNQTSKSMILDAQSAMENIPQGLMGRVAVGWMKNFDTENPALGEWQKVKMVLTDAQLLNTAKTKGAISDKEMELFAKAAANDNVAAIAAMKPVFDRLISFIESDDKASVLAFQHIYGEDPTQWPELSGVFSPQTSNAGDQGASRNSFPQEVQGAIMQRVRQAIASGQQEQLMQEMLSRGMNPAEWGL